MSVFTSWGCPAWTHLLVLFIIIANNVGYVSARAYFYASPPPSSSSLTSLYPPSYDNKFSSPPSNSSSPSYNNSLPPYPIQDDNIVKPQAPPTAPPISSPSHNLLVLTWPPGYCSAKAKKGSKGGSNCKNPVPQYFTIHGLWPEFIGNNQRHESTEICDTAKLTPITRQLQDKWPNLRKEPPNQEPNKNFWTHEWKSHGTYSGLGVLGYFRKSLSMCNALDLKKKLGGSKQKVTSGGSYKLATLQAAIKAVYGVEATIVCVLNNQREGLEQIKEVMFNYTASYVQQDMVTKISNCDSIKLIYFP